MRLDRGEQRSCGATLALPAFEAPERAPGSHREAPTVFCDPIGLNLDSAKSSWGGGSDH